MTNRYLHAMDMVRELKKELKESQAVIARLKRYWCASCCTYEKDPDEDGRCQRCGTPVCCKWCRVRFATRVHKKGCIGAF